MKDNTEYNIKINGKQSRLVTKRINKIKGIATVVVTTAVTTIVLATGSSIKDTIETSKLRDTFIDGNEAYIETMTENDLDSLRSFASSAINDTRASVYDNPNMNQTQAKVLLDNCDYLENHLRSCSTLKEYQDLAEDVAAKLHRTFMEYRYDLAVAQTNQIKNAQL